MLCAALVAAASILALPPLAVGPEASVPSPSDAAVRSSNVAVTSDGRDYVAAWTAPDAVFAQKIDGTTGARVGNVPNALVAGTASRSAAKIASNGAGYLVAWTEGQKIVTAATDSNAVLVSTQTAITGNHVSSPSQLRVTPSGNGYLLVWLEDAGSNPVQQRIVTLPVDNFGKATDAPAIVADALPPVSELAAASHASTTMISAILSGGTIQSYAVQPGTKGPDPTVIGTYAGSTSLFSFWDGGAFEVAWSLSGNQPVLATLSETAVLERPPAAINGTMILDAVATNPNGTVLLGHSFAPLMLRLGRSGNIVDSAPRQLPNGINIPVTAAAGNSNSYLLVLSTPDLMTVRSTLSDNTAPTLQTLGVTQPPQGFPRIAAGDTTQFVGWMDTRRTDSPDIYVSRFRSGAFLDAGVNIGRGDSFGVAASHDNAAIALLAVGAPAIVSARFMDATGTLSQPMLLASVNTFPGRSYRLPDITALNDGSFVALFTESSPSPFSSTPDVTMSAVTFNSTSSSASVKLPFDTRERLGANAAAAPYANGYVLAYESQPLGLLGVSLVEFDRNHTPLNAALRLSAPDFPSGFPDIATDGAGHALAVWSERINTSAPQLTTAIVDLASSTVTVRKAFTTIPSHAHVTWTGKAFVIVTDNLDVMRMNVDGTVTDTLHLTAPYPTHDAAIASSTGAGTAFVYARPVVDSSAADVDRVQLRTVMEAYPRLRVVKH